MRPIDADSLIDLVTDSTILGDGFKTAFCALVNGEPTIKVQKTGHWIYKNGAMVSPWYSSYECSECRALESAETRYCPHCGSRNRGEEE